RPRRGPGGGRHPGPGLVGRPGAATGATHLGGEPATGLRWIRLEFIGYDLTRARTKGMLEVRDTIVIALGPGSPFAKPRVLGSDRSAFSSRSGSGLAWERTIRCEPI